MLQTATEVAFGCPAAKAAADRATNGVPAWRYRYMAVWDNVALVPGMGSYHSSEIPIALGTNPLRPNSTADVPEEAALEKVMVHAWAEFAKDPDAGLSRLGWPRYNASGVSTIYPWRSGRALICLHIRAGNTLIRLGFNNMSTLNLGKSTQYDQLCGLQLPGFGA